MRLTQFTYVAISFIVGALASLLAANLAVKAIETNSKDAVEDAMILHGHEWVDVQADGLQLVLSGTAPNEAARFRALAAAGGEIDAARVIDNMSVPEADAIKPPRFSIEILRNDAGISMIGLIPSDTDRDALIKQVQKIARGSDVTDLLETADYPVPLNWGSTLDYALFALKTLPRSKISMDAGKVTITAVSDSAEQQAEWSRDLKRKAPSSTLLSIDISAPRPVITPFTLRFLIDENGARFDACSAHNTVGRAKIISAATEAGLVDVANCIIGLGVPSPDWADAAEMGIEAVRDLGGGSVTFSDADVTLVATADTPQEVFDRVVGELESNLPDLYSLHSVLPEPVKIDGSGDGDGPPEFVATRSPEGLVQLRGRLTDETLRDVTESFARAKFGTAAVYPATRLDPELPLNWPTRVLAALEAMSYLSSGVVVVQPDVVDISGLTGDPDASATISRVLSEKLGASQNFQVNVTYQELLDPELNKPSPDECVSEINAILSDAKIAFAPGSANIEASAAETVDRIAEVMRECAEIRMEIAGYTDSQGREEMNQALSQNRAQAVLNALLARRILTTNLTAKGYGEADPIADNGTEEGREANRRIEFRLLDLPQEEETAQDPSSETDQQAEDGEPASDEKAEAQTANNEPEAGATDTSESSEDQPENVTDAPEQPEAEETPASVETETETASNAEPLAEDNVVADTPAEPSDESPEILTPSEDVTRPAPRPER